MKFKEFLQSEIAGVPTPGFRSTRTTIGPFDMGTDLSRWSMRPHAPGTGFQNFSQWGTSATATARSEKTIKIDPSLPDGSPGNEVNYEDFYSGIMFLLQKIQRIAGIITYTEQPESQEVQRALHYAIQAYQRKPEMHMGYIRDVGQSAITGSGGASTQNILALGRQLKVLVPAQSRIAADYIDIDMNQLRNTFIRMKNEFSQFEGGLQRFQEMMGLLDSTINMLSRVGTIKQNQTTDPFQFAAGVGATR